MPIRKKTALGSLWNLTRTLTTNATDFIVYVMLARVLSIEQFALVIFCLLIVEFASIFTQVGVAQNLIQRSKWEISFASSTFSFMSAFSLGISLVLASAGALVAFQMHSMQAVYIVLALSSIPFMTGMHTVLGAKMERDFKQGKITAISAGTNIFSGLIAILLIMMGWGLWALVVQKVLNHLILLILFALNAKFVPKFSIEAEHLHELKVFCLPLLGNAILAYLNRKMNNFYAALVLGANAFALISIAKKGEEVLSQSTLTPINKMIVPALSRLPDNQKTQAFYRLLEMSSYIIVPCFLGLGAVAKPFIELTFGELYLPSANLLSISSVAIMANVLMWFLPNLLISIAQTKAALYLNIVTTLTTFAIGAITIFWGLHALVIGLTIASYMLIPVKIYIVSKHIKLSVNRMLNIIMPPSIAGVIMVFMIYGIQNVAGTFLDWSAISLSVQLGLLIIIGFVTYILVLLFGFKRKFILQIKEMKRLSL